MAKSIKDYFATPEEDRLDKEFDAEIKTNLLGITQQAIDGFKTSNKRHEKRLAKLLGALHTKINCKHMQSIYRGVSQ
jgi:hypothetical protein